MGQIIAVEDRLRKWQTKHNLDPDGDLGPLAMARMEELDEQIAECQSQRAKCQRDLIRCRNKVATQKSDEAPSFWLPAGIGFIIGALIALAF